MVARHINFWAMIGTEGVTTAPNSLSTIRAADVINHHGAIDFFSRVKGR